MKLNIDGLNVNIFQKGNGKDIVFLHGWGCDINIYNPVIEKISDKMRVTAIDLMGFGESDEPTSPCSGDDYANNVIKILEKLDIKKPILVGHSHGGRVIINMTGVKGYKASKIILIDSAGTKAKRTMKYYVKIYLYKIGKKILSCPLWKSAAKGLYEKFVSNAGSDDYKNSSPVMRGTLSKVVNEDYKKVLSNIKMPTLLIWGDKDTATPISDAHIMEKNIPDAGLVVIPETGHYSFLENFPMFMAVLNEFLKNDYQ